jgi:hypothetical protein
MADYLDRLIQQNYNADGTMKPGYRQELILRGLSESEINEREERHIRNARLDQEVAQRRQELAEMQESSPLGKIPEQQPLVIRTNEVDTRSMTSQERRAFEISGLDYEELMSQGFLEPDDFYTPTDEQQDVQQVHTLSNQELDWEEF